MGNILSKRRRRLEQIEFLNNVLYTAALSAIQSSPAREQERTNSARILREEYDAAVASLAVFPYQLAQKSEQGEKDPAQETDDSKEAIDLFQKHGQLELAQWPDIKAIKEASENGQQANTELEKMSRSILPTGWDDPESETRKACEFVAIPFHDPVQTRLYFIAKWNNKAKLAEQDERYRLIMDLAARGGLHDVLLNNQVFGGHINEAAVRLSRQRVCRNFDAAAAGSRPLNFATVSEEEVGRDLENAQFLKYLDQFNCSKCTAAGENGYTGVFTGGCEYDISALENHFLTRNTGPPECVGEDVITIAISYKHYWEDRSRKLNRVDLKEIARFIKASQAVSVRFWIDTRLPPSEDGSFEKWLARGVGPYARYMTLICPSAAASSNRFWLSMEKHIAMSSKGIFYFEKGGIYFTSRPSSDKDTLAYRMLQVMVGELKVPPGVNKEEEGKVAQWALGFLGSRQNMVFSFFSGPKLDDMTFGDYNEITAMTRIAAVIKRFGSLKLPVVSGMAWNKQNPLLKGSSEHQQHRMVNWLGLANPDDKRTIYFVALGELLVSVSDGEEKCVALRVTFRHGDSYDSASAEGIEEKMLGEFPTADFLKMTTVTVPAICHWPAFIDNQ